MFGQGFKLKYALIDIAAWPYARALRYSTIQQAEEIRTSSNIDALESALSAWTDSKEKEFKYIAIAATVSAGANVSVFSWNDVPGTIWYARALWYMSLVFSIMALISIVQVAVMVEDINHYLTGTEQKSRLHRVNSEWRHSSRQSSRDSALQTLRSNNNEKKISIPNAKHSRDFKNSDDHTGQPDQLPKLLEQCISLLFKRRYPPQKRLLREPIGYLSTDWSLDGFMLFVWQSPMMFASYSWVVFLLALALHVIRPFIQKATWGDDHKIAITFLCLFFTSVAVCMWCAWYPHYKRLRIGNENCEHKAVQMSSKVLTVLQVQKASNVQGSEHVEAAGSDPGMV